MVDLINYDVYVDNGDGWDFSARFDEDKKHEAYALAQQYQNISKPVKIVREIFDIDDNTYTERLEYVGGFYKKKKVEPPVPIRIPRNVSKPVKPKEAKKKFVIKDSIVKALFKLIFIVIVSLIITHIFVTFIFPIVESLSDYKDIKTVVFIIYFVVFLVISIPLLVKKVPWEVFLVDEEEDEQKSYEDDFYEKAIYVNSIYNINSGTDFPPAPVARNVSIEYKNDVISFLDMVINSLDRVSIKDDFTKLGIKFVIFGGVMEFARYSGLSLPYANALLSEAFSVIDGNDVSLEEFYEVKVAYKDSEMAIVLTGLGASWMNAMLFKRDFKKSTFNKMLKRWKNQMDKDNDEPLNTFPASTDNLFKVVVGIKSVVKHDDFMDEDHNVGEESVRLVRERVNNIMYNLAKKYGGKPANTSDDYFEFSFNKINSSIKFSVDFIQTVEKYQNSVNIPVKCNESCAILPYHDDNISDVLSGILRYSYENEVIIVESIYEKVKDDYKFSYLGLKKVSESVPEQGLYELHF